jgi:hypothetical protein
MTIAIFVILLSAAISDISIYDLCITPAGKRSSFFLSPLWRDAILSRHNFREIDYIAFGRPAGKAFPLAKFI